MSLTKADINDIKLKFRHDRGECPDECWYCVEEDSMREMGLDEAVHFGLRDVGNK